MGFRFTDEQESFRCEIRSFLVGNLGEDWPHIRKLGVQMVGLYGVLDKGPKWAFLNEQLAWEWMDSISFTIRGGTSDIQHNISSPREDSACHMARSS